MKGTFTPIYRVKVPFMPGWFESREPSFKPNMVIATVEFELHGQADRSRP